MKSHQRNKHLGYLPCQTLGTISEVDKRTKDNELGLVAERTLYFSLV